MAVKVDDLMREIEDEVRRARRKRLLAHGAASEYQDPRVYAHVDGILRRAIELRDHDALLLPELAGGEDSCNLATHLRFGSHRRTFGWVVVFAKRRILLPAMRWLYEYSLDNFRRQERVNRVLFACIEELAIENARLRLAFSELQDGRMAGLQEGAGELQDGRIAGLQEGTTKLQDGRIVGLQEGIAGLPDGRIAGGTGQLPGRETEAERKIESSGRANAAAGE